MQEQQHDQKSVGQKGIITGARKEQADLVLTIDMGDGNASREERVPFTDAKKWSMGTEVTFGLRKVRRPRAKNGDGAAAPKKKK